MFEKRTAVVTGAGSGVGRETAIALAREGAAVGLIGRRVESLLETAGVIEANGGRVLVAAADIRDELAVNEAVSAVVTAFGGVDILIHAAAVGLYGAVENYSLEHWRQTIDTNLTGLFLLCRAVLPVMRERGGGAIIAIGSGAGKQGYANLAAYSASKFGLLGFMESLAAEAGPYRIKVSTINPGSILTSFAGRSVEEKQRQRDEGRKYLDPRDVTESILYLLRQSDRAWTREMNLWPF